MTYFQHKLIGIEHYEVGLTIKQLHSYGLTLPIYSNVKQLRSLGLQFHQVSVKMLIGLFLWYYA